MSVDTPLDSPPQSETPRTAARRNLFVTVLAYLAFSLLLPLIPVPFRSLHLWQIALLITITTMAFMLLQIKLSQALVGVQPSPLRSFLALVLSLLAWALVIFFLHPHRHWPMAVNIPLRLFRPLLIGFPISLACTFLGILLSPIIREPNVLLPVAFIAMPIDYIGAMTSIGFTQNVVNKHPEIVHQVSVAVPTAGGVSGLHPMSMIGPGDVLFMAFFFAIVQRLQMNMRGTFWWMYGLLTVTMLMVIIGNWNIAALIPMGLAVLIANFTSFRLQRSEVFASLYAAIIVLALVIGFYVYSHAHFFGHH